MLFNLWGCLPEILHTQRSSMTQFLEWSLPWNTLCWWRYDIPLAMSVAKDNLHAGRDTCRCACLCVVTSSHATPNYSSTYLTQHWGSFRTFVLYQWLIGFLKEVLFVSKIPHRGQKKQLKDRNIDLKLNSFKVKLFVMFSYLKPQLMGMSSFSRTSDKLPLGQYSVMMLT